MPISSKYCFETISHNFACEKTHAKLIRELNHRLNPYFRISHISIYTQCEIKLPKWGVEG